MNRFMKNQVNLLVALFGIVVFMSSCQNDELPINTLDEFAQEQNETFGGDFPRTCGSADKMEQLLADPEYKKVHQEKFKKVEEVLQNPAFKMDCSNPKIIPVAVHFQGANTSASLACLRELAQSQVDILNADFGGTNSDISNWNNSAASYFPGISNGEACFQFCLADQNHPSGFGLSNGDLAVTKNATTGDFNANWSGYLNFFVQPNTGVLGYAPLGGSGNGDGVVIDASAFGGGTSCGNITANAPYNLGRTVTHEVGHYLLLDHIWGNGCSTDDLVADTPDQASDNGGCPSINTTSCGSRDMHMNYMDYTNDACMYMFSAGQISRAEGYINSSLTNLTNNASSKCSDNTGGGDAGGGDTGGGDTGGGDTGGGTDDVCDTPTGFNVIKISPAKVRVKWTAEPNAIKYKIKFRKKGTTAWSVKTATNPQKNLVGLTANTVYQYRVRTQCPSGWTAWSPTKQFQTLADPGSGGSTGCDGQEVTVQVTLDYYGSETSWEVINDSGQTVMTGGPYSDNQEGAVKTATECLPSGCYTLFLDDSYGDGICCDNGDGYLEVQSNGVPLTGSDGFFGYYDELDFCISPSGLKPMNQRRDVRPMEMPAKIK